MVYLVIFWDFFRQYPWREIVYLTATYFHILWKFYLVTFGNFSGSTPDERLFIWLPLIFIYYENFTSSLLGIFQAAPLTRDCLFWLPFVATLILSSIMGPLMFLFLGCITCLLILHGLLPPLILGLAQSASLRLLGSVKLKI